MMKCKSCDNKIQDKNKFCPFCGTPDIDDNELYIKVKIKFTDVGLECPFCDESDWEIHPIHIKCVNCEKEMLASITLGDVMK